MPHGYGSVRVREGLCTRKTSTRGRDLDTQYQQVATMMLPISNKKQPLTADL
ncbi:hypothetical protein GZL_04764 [Streptomyces sp. 769]|nr:hypothetical protein GZL_04764 [Streptomyces sp. 769]